MPHEILFSIAVNEDLIFTDWISKAGELIQVQRTATLPERIQCATAVLPYYVSKKPVAIEHQGEVRVLHALAESALDSVTLDEQGQVIDDADFEEVE